MQITGQITKETLGIVAQVSSLCTSQYFILLEAAKPQVNTHAARIDLSNIHISLCPFRKPEISSTS